MKRTIAIVLVLTAGIIYACTGGKSDSNSTFEESVITNSSSIDEPGITTDSDKDGNGISGVDDAPVQQEQPQRQTVSITSDKPIELTAAEFKKYIFDMDKNPKEWVYNGELPAIVDFYAVWCGPCKMAAPPLAELAKEYEGKVNIFKIDAEKERVIANYFGVRGYPTFMVIPASGQPRMFSGLPQGVRSQADIKPAFQKIIEAELL